MILMEKGLGLLFFPREPTKPTKIIRAWYVNLDADVNSVSYANAWAHVNYNAFLCIIIVV